MAADMGADGVELDVQISKDGRLVVFHDDELSRLTGITGSVADYTYAELCRMPVIHAVDATERDVAPLLEDVLALLHERGLSVNIELKTAARHFLRLRKRRSRQSKRRA
ncbi:MAG: glycerophosphodiester phosphodiesterase [Christensenellales bacterium]